MSSINASADFDRVPKEELPRYLSIFGDQVLRTVNGGLDFATNFNAKTVSVTFSSANNDTTVTNPLSRVPVGYFVVGQTAAMIVYNGVQPNTATTITFRADATGTANILVF